MRCQAVVSTICPKGHNQRKKCFEPILCVECDREAKAAEAKRQKEISRQQKCDEEEAEHLRTLKEIEDQLAEHQQLRRGVQLKEEPKNEIREKLAELEERRSVNHLSNPSSSMTITPPCASSRSSPSRQNMAQTLAPPPQLVHAAPYPQTVKISHDSKRTSTETPAISCALSPSEAEWRLRPKQQLKTPRSAEDAHDNWVSGSDAEVPSASAARDNAASASKEKGFKEELTLVLQKDRAKRDELKQERESQRWKEIATQRQREKLDATSKACRETHEKARELEVGRGTLSWRRSSSASPAPTGASAAHSWTASSSPLTSFSQPPFRPLFRSPVSPTPANPSTGLYIPPHRQT
jgi:hypothetical protein